MALASHLLHSFDLQLKHRVGSVPGPCQATGPVSEASHPGAALLAHHGHGHLNAMIAGVAQARP